MSSHCTHKPIRLSGGHVIVPQLSCDLGAKRMESASLHAHSPLGRLPVSPMSLIFELDYEELAF